MSEPKQVIVMRKDLNMRKGKIAAQASHSSVKVILDLMVTTYDGSDVIRTLSIDKATALNAWIEGRFTKICVYVNSEAELVEIYNKANKEGLLCSLITDAGLTEFNGVPTITCAAIGPAFPDQLIGITNELPLL